MCIRDRTKPLIYHNDGAPESLWELFFNDSPNKEYCTEQINPSIDFYKGGFYIYKCIFYNLWSPLYISTHNLKVVHSECTFTRCRCSQGGAIYVQGECSIVQHRYCTSSCSSTNAGSHSCIDLIKDSQTNLNYDLEGSLSCNIGTTGTNFHLKGKLIISSMNYSKNLAVESACFWTNSPSINTVNYSNFEENHATTHCQIFYNYNTIFSMDHCNILKNYQEDGLYATIYSAGNLSFDYCSFLGDLGEGAVFYSDSRQITLSHSYYDNLAANANITNIENQQSSESNTLTFFVNFECNTQMTVNQNQIKCYCSPGESISYPFLRMFIYSMPTLYKIK